MLRHHHLQLTPDDPGDGNGGIAGVGAGDVDALARLLAARRVVVLTGAGCSTESGIPDYRGNGQPVRRAPIQHDAFLRRPEVRQRYWARAAVGWERFCGARPNAAHAALARLESAGLVQGLITQNVDRLHRAAGSRRVVELHGALEDVSCLDCGAAEARGALQARLLAANPGWLVRAATALAPDGDAELSTADEREFHVVGCGACAGGTLMPDVVFFGGSVPQARVEAAWELVNHADILLVVGSSLTVYSGWRFVKGAAERAIPIAVVNLGPTRGDDLSRLRIAAPAGRVLPQLVSRLGFDP